MAHPAVIPVVLFCTALSPAIDKVAGAFPKLPLPLAVALTVVDAGCSIVLHIPPVAALKQILPDVWAVVGDLPPRKKDTLYVGPAFHHGR